MKKSNIQSIFAVLLVVLAVVSRILYAKWGLYNFTPLAAIGLFSVAGLNLRRYQAFMIPLAGQLLADLYFQFFTSTPGFYADQVYNYSAIVLSTAFGMLLTNPKPGKTMAFLFGSTTLFFLVSNFGYFLGGYNGYSFSGLVKTYWDAIPFYRNSLIGNLAVGSLLFGAWHVITTRRQLARA